MKEKLFDVPRRVLAGVAALLALAAVVVLTAMSGSTMQPLPASAPAGEFSAERALKHLEAFATRPRPIGSQASAQARDYLVERMRAAGLEVRVQRAVGANPSTGLASFGQVDNVVATRRGTDPTGTVVIAAHYDSAAMGPGTSDDAAAVASMLETVRALGDARLRNDLVFLMTDGEEDGVLGAEAFVREHPLGRKGGVLLNWEARGVSGPSLMFETSPGNAGLVGTFADAVPFPRGDSMMVELYRLLPNNTDFTPMTKAGFRGMNFAYIQESSRYHTADDSLAHLNRGSLQHHGTNMLALARTLGAADLPALDADHDVTYFRLFGVLLTYPNGLVWPLAGLAVAAVAGLAFVAWRRRLAGPGRMAVGAISGVVPVAAAALLAQGLWEVLVAMRPDYYGMGGLLHRPDVFRLAVAVLAGLAVLGWYLPLRRRLGPAALAIGALAWPALLGVVCAQVAPGASFMFALPALFAALGGLAALLLRRPALRVAALTAGLVVGAALLPGLALTAFDGMGLALGGASAAVLALFGLVALPAVELWLPEPHRPLARPVAFGVPLVAAALAVALVPAGLAVDAFDAAHPRRTHLAYVMDAETRQAGWVSADLAPSEWTRRYVSGRDTSSLPPGYARGALWTGPAPAVDLDGPRVTVLRQDGGTYRLRVTAGRGARSLTLRVERPVVEATAKADGMRAVTVPVTGTRANTWPGEVRFRGIPAGGAEITLKVVGTGELRVTAIGERDGFASVPGFAPMPAGLVAATREDGGLVAITRTYRL
ncbi:Peptidase, M20/M25/M40 family [[Actinomadura] parvosata subsp. kistnae]|uniref:Aminopeptidase n=1 Tax=[Actinomadura] parvosata subsp. kistnae TaxID=1909395 RepID=A0A1V0AD76_9ACTN|nr:M28 family peptidase [Nonomuraea sp. ATCC 55076]AQZ68180.1 aminopeptidase [Nonomuraea sp. ATCC 55076]SPL93427.1 Peptidase, M20/M25/M40 family [Actinomadura parvosata subsp. kistnae]